MGRRPVTYIIVALLLAVALSSCTSQEARDVDAVAQIWGPKNIDKMDAMEIPFAVEFGAGPLEGGTAVLCGEDDSAFWVKNRKVYAVNDIAKKMLPELDPAPPEITYDDVKRVAR
jgi:hypothetical protein